MVDLVLVSFRSYQALYLVARKLVLSTWVGGSCRSSRSSRIMMTAEVAISVPFVV